MERGAQNLSSENTSDNQSKNSLTRRRNVKTQLNGNIEMNATAGQSSDGCPNTALAIAAAIATLAVVAEPPLTPKG